MAKSRAIFWFRCDLRLHDNPGLLKAIKDYDEVVPVYIWSSGTTSEWARGAASCWWLHDSLLRLNESLKAKGSKLVCRSGKSELEVLQQIVKETGANALFWGRRYEPFNIDQDTKIKNHFSKSMVVESFNHALLWEPWEIKSDEGRSYQVYTAFWKKALKTKSPPEPLPEPKNLKPPVSFPKSEDIADWGLKPRIDWDAQFYKSWEPGETEALKKIKAFKPRAKNYAQTRNFPYDEQGTSRLSPHLHFGEISPRYVWHHILKDHRSLEPVEVYLKEIAWREFAYHLLYHFPQTPNKPLREKFENFPWKNDKKGLLAWQNGLTGYPIVDAGMRELWKTGWMHNRVRMIVASFLVKDLLISWSEGARWFWDTLVDADLASNTLGWQWAGGCGADAAPYFRVFHPVLQGEKFDPDGTYVKRFVPELKGLPEQWIHKPWEAPPLVLKAAGVELGDTYPLPIVDHAVARVRALEAFNKIK